MIAPVAANAQSSFVNTYHVQVQKMYVLSGGTQWETVMSTTNYQDALLMQDLLEAALDTGTINSVLGNSDWRSTYIDVKIKTEYPNLYSAPYSFPGPNLWYVQPPRRPAF